VTSRPLLLLVLVLCFVSPVVAAPLNAQPPYWLPTTGFVDPTAATANGGHPAVACDPNVTPGCATTALVNQNTDAFNWAVTQACTAPYPWIWTPPQAYPYARGGTSHNQSYGILVSGCPAFVWVGYGTTLRQTGNLGQGEFDGVVVENGSTHARFLGIHFSQRDMTASPVVEQSHNLSLGQNTTIDDVQAVDCTFDEGYGGDSIRMFGTNYEGTGVVSRVLVTRSRLDGYRDGLSFQHGTSMVDAYSNFFGPTQTLPLHHEPTSAGGNNYENIVGNLFYAWQVGQPMSLAFSGAGIGPRDGTHDIAFAFNTVIGYVAAIGTSRRFTMVGNVIDDTDNIQDNSAILFGEALDDFWLEYNQIEDNGSNSSNVVLESRNGESPQSLWLWGNEMSNYSNAVCNTTVGCGGGIDTIGTYKQWVEHNLLTYNSASGVVGNESYGCIAAQSDGYLWGSGSSSITPIAVYTSGWYIDNTCRRDLQSNGSQAGGMGIGVNVTRASVGAGAQGIGRTLIRGNTIDGAEYPFNDNVGTSWPQGPQIISQNRLLNITGAAADQFAVNAWVRDSTARTETLTGSTVTTDRSLQTSVVAPAGAASVTVADGVKAGQVKELAFAPTATATITVTFAHCGNCSTETVASSPTALGALEAVWDATSSEWWLLDRTSNVTP
jgi:hypothetical protein